MKTLKFHDMVYAGQPTAEQVDRIVEYHLEPLQEIAHSVHIDHVVCFRDKLHEAKHRRRPETDTEYRQYPILSGRKYWSEHCFEISDRSPEGKGACDISSRNLLSLASLLVEHIPYSRFAYYEAHKFIHCDYAYGYYSPKYYGADWVEISEEEYFERIYRSVL